MNDELLAVGSSFRGYVILRKIGAGGTGEVYLARHLTLGVNTAVKVVKREVVECSREARTRFSREVRTLARIRNPALVAIHDAGFDDATGLYFIVMDYLPGGTVADELKRVHRFSVKKALRIVRSVADGLLALERKGFVHRDVKPGNMLIAEDGSVRLSDLGIVRETGPTAGTVTQLGFALGTPAYMSYEQIVDSHAVDIRADIYALGISLFEMLTGHLPDGELSATKLLKKRIDGERIPDVRTVNAAIPDWLAETIVQMTEPDAEARLGSLSELVALLDARLAELEPKENALSFRKAERRTPVRYLFAGILLGIFFLAVAIALVFDREIGLRIARDEASSEDVRSSEPDGSDTATLPSSVPSSPRTNERPRVVVREVVRVVTNEVMRTVAVTTVVVQVEEKASAPVAEPVPATPVTNVVEGVEIRGMSDMAAETECLSEMISFMAEMIRSVYGLAADRTVQSLVKVIELQAGDERYAFVRATRTVRVGVGYGGFPRTKAAMANMCAGFMTVYEEGVADPFTAQVRALVRERAVKKVIADEDYRPSRKPAGNAAVGRLLELECMQHPRFFSDYFRVRREVYAKGLIFGPLSVHDFAAIVSRATGETVFPYLRRHGVKVDEFATNIKMKGLPAAEFFVENAD